MAFPEDIDSPFSRLIQVVSGDVMDAAKTADEQKTAQSFRHAIRTIFAGAEAIVWYMKALTARVVELNAELYSPYELAALKDETYTVATNGKVNVRANFVPISTSLRLISSLLLCAQVSDVSLELHPSAMATLEQSLKIRHRLTHPKSATDMDVTVADFHGALESWAVVLTLGLNTAMEVDKRLGTAMFPIWHA
jgi:hypothetical protein